MSFAAGWIGSRYIPGQWYAALAKPAWTPPDAVFGPVWSLLYLLMGIAAWLVWRRAGFKRAGGALALFIGQLGLNALWSYLFFGAHLIGVALLELAVLGGAVLLVTIRFWRRERPAGLLMLPYLLWVGFAFYLNFAFWWLNRV